MFATVAANRVSLKMKKPRKSKNKNFLKLTFIIILLLLAAFFYYKASDANLPQLTISPVEQVQTEKPADAEKLAEKAFTTEEVPLLHFDADLEIPLCPANRKTDAGVDDHEIRKFENYAICYRESYEQAEWSAYCLSDYQLEKNADRSNDFRSDPMISTGSAQLSDYRKSGFDRGHLTPAADMSFNGEAMSETFFMSNMSPQAPAFNRGIWKDLEAQVRLWVQKFGRVWIVSGPILNKDAAEYQSIGENQVAVPEYFYKVILVPLYEDQADRQSPDDAKAAIALGFVIPNQKCEDSFWNYARSIDEIEKLTGLDFYSLLPDENENQIEKSFCLEDWK